MKITTNRVQLIRNSCRAIELQRLYTVYNRYSTIALMMLRMQVHEQKNKSKSKVYTDLEYIIYLLLLKRRPHDTTNDTH